MDWIERQPKEGDTVKIVWSDWYAHQIGYKTTIGVYLGHRSGRYCIDIGDRLVLLCLPTLLVYGWKKDEFVVDEY